MMTETHLSLGDRMAAAIDRQLSSGPDYELTCGDDLSDEAFRQAYEQLSRRRILRRDIERVLERTRQLRNEFFSLFGPPPPPGHLLRREWEEHVRGRLIGYFAMTHTTTVRTKERTNDPQKRVLFDDDTRTITVDGVAYPAIDSIMYRVWKIVYKNRPELITETEIMKEMGRTAAISISKRRRLLPPALNSMLKARRSAGYEVRLPVLGMATR